LGFDAGDGNLYRYARNKTLVSWDPSGLAWTRITGNKYGDWHIQQYKFTGLGKVRGTSTDIKFEPKELVVKAKRIAFVQIVRMHDNNTGKEFYIDPASEKRATTDGWAIDRAYGTKKGKAYGQLGWYGYFDDGRPDGEGMKQEGSSPPAVPAVMFDGPNVNRWDVEVRFETYAICKTTLKEGEKQPGGIVFSGLKWGYDIDNKGSVTLVGGTFIASPEKEFWGAVGLWNDQASGKTPVPAGQLPFGTFQEP
jgi:hypothetical protein